MTRIELFCSDLDGTLLGNPEASRRFKHAWEALPSADRPVLCYASGRLIPDVFEVLATDLLPRPEYVIGGVGTQLVDGRTRRPVAGFKARIRQGWDLGRIKLIVSSIPGITAQPDRFVHAFKSSWFLPLASPDLLADLERRLASGGISATLVYSSGRDLDVLPRGHDKGGALAWLCRHLRIGLSSVLVAGDTGNDASLFLLPGVQGIVVENAQPELHEAVVHLPTFSANGLMADGVLEGLAHFGVLEAARTSLRVEPPSGDLDPTFRMLLSGVALGTLSEDERKLIATAYDRALAVVRRNITPLGFSACSLADNEVTGTDVNYRSVWARDGSITIVATCDVEDADIRAAQRTTLRTLLDHLAPNGQVPANVRIDDRLPEYCGVGGICSIDSALWAVIAFYHYVRRTQDLDLLAEYGDRLQRVMSWLGALDSNNDGLLEIPEAGDWTDLFGRSYHVLYDEVLWYRALVSFGRLMELRQELENAASALRRSQLVRSRILSAFWPSTGPRDQGRIGSFAEQQFSVGDARYLLAEITPFSFNWRCDVLGNVQAFLSNVLDIERARTAFRFMWGVGVNDPYPVVNLYPPVQAGDPDWRPYYTVNLLNLPGHYHNGGIWPFIGGMWVRFIHRLGLHDVACRELLKLAELCRLGRQEEWEFNEWVHSRTGRPMGKRYQAWSAAAFIHACQELQVSPDRLGDG